MPRRALRPSFVVTFALSAAAIASGCSSKDSGNGSIGDSSIGDGSNGDSSVPFCNPPNACYCNNTCAGIDDAAPDVYDAGPDGGDAGPDVYEGGPDVPDAGPDGEGQDGGHD